MTFRARLTLALLALAVIPLLVLGYGVRHEMRARLDADATRRVDAVAVELDARLGALLANERRRLESLAAELATDNRFRAALADPGSAERRWLLDWAATTMRPMGLAVLQLQDSSGRILSSGQFRNDFDRVAPAVPRAIASSPAQAAVVDARTPGGAVRVIATSATFNARGATFTVTGGASFDSARVAALSPDASVEALLVTRGVRPAAGAVAGGSKETSVEGAVAGGSQEVSVEGAVTIDSFPYVNDAGIAAAADGDATGSARIVLLHDTGPTTALKAGVTRWLLITLGGTLLLAILIASVLGRVISAPIVELSGRTARLDLDRLDQRFATGRDDELGALERTLDALTGRLRTSVARLREAERAAATGDLARQVNHDIKNGLAPIRNVLRHLAQVAEREPDTLAPIFIERRATLESSVEYLDALARNYARLSPTLRREPTDPRPIVLEVANKSGVMPARIEVRVPDKLPHVLTDAVVLHRILDNLVSNAVDALEGKPGTVTIGAEAATEGVSAAPGVSPPADGALAATGGAERRRSVRFTITDTGRGMTRDELKLAFDDFHTTKPAGTGLGLSVVRRLLTDIGGSMRVETAPGEGTTFTVELPAADPS